MKKAKQIKNYFEEFSHIKHLIIIMNTYNITTISNRH